MSGFELEYCKRCKVYYEMSFVIGLQCPHCRKKDEKLKHKIDQACKMVKPYIENLTSERELEDEKL